MLPWKKAEAAVVGTRGAANLSWSWEEGFREEMTTVVNSKEKFRVNQEKVSEKFNTGRTNRCRPTGPQQWANQKTREETPRVRGPVWCVDLCLHRAGEERRPQTVKGPASVLEVLDEIHTCTDWVNLNTKV